MRAEISSIPQTAGLGRSRNQNIRFPFMTGTRGGRMYEDCWLLYSWK